MNTRLVGAILLLALVGLPLPVSFAQTPTVEPTKRPYVFPTPIFIPTYPNDTPQPPPRVTPTVPAATVLPTEEQTYTVQPGDSLWTIAQKVYGNGALYPLIAQANDITATTRLRVGMVLKIPGAPGIATPTPTPGITAQVTPTPLSLPTLALPTLTPTATLTIIPAASPTDTLTNALSLLAALCALASLVSALFAYLTYARAQRLKSIEEGKPPLRLR